MNYPITFFVFLLIFFHPEAVIGIEHLEGVVGSDARLPCYLRSPDPHDRAILALWYKQGRRLPLYSYDARGRNERQQPDKVLEGRGTFDTTGTPAYLMLNPVQASDAGTYTCRVDYVTSPTHKTVVNFTIIKPPEIMTITDQDQNHLENKTKPINEGSPLELTCLVIGGDPSPTVGWYSDSLSNNLHSDVSKSGHIQTTLKISEVKRSFHNKIYSCKAKNNDKIQPLIKNITIDMNLRPLSAQIKVPTKPLIAGVPYAFTCESKGSKPSSTIKWFLEEVPIRPSKTNTNSGPGEVTIGRANIELDARDNGKSVKCVASNPEIDASEIAHVIKLKVHYPPIVSLKLGRNLNPRQIKQGADVYFECQVQANPKPYKYTWFKDGKEIQQNLTQNIIVTETSLVLQKVSRKSAGKYTCQSSNTQGTKISNKVKLDIMFAPECLIKSDGNEPVVLGVGRGEAVNISCHVASNPLKAMFHWQLNGSEKSYQSFGVNTKSGHLTSKYSFVGTLDKDYGTLLCWANNSVGTQEEACQFNIIPAGPPSPPENCVILNHTAENIEVFCDKGFHGGLTQAFLAEVFDEAGSLHLNITSDEPQFSVDSLRPGTTYVIRVTAFNAKGRSAPISLTAYTLKVAEKRMGETESILYSPLILIFLGILGGFVSIIIILILVTRWRKTITSGSVTVRSSAPPKILQKDLTVAHGDNVGLLSSSINLTTVSDNKEIKQSTQSTSEVELSVDKIKPKPKKQVMVVENGKIERPGISSTSPTDSTNIRDHLLPRQLKDTYLPNGGAGYYNSLSKTSMGPSSTPPSHYKMHSSPYSSPTYSSSSAYSPTYGTAHHHQHPHSPHNSSLPVPCVRTLPAQPVGPSRMLTGGALSPLLEEYSSPYNHHYSTLPRKRGTHGEYLRDDEYQHRLGSRGPSASVEDRYHLMPEWKGNPKYLIRTRDREDDDESFV